MKYSIGEEIELVAEKFVYGGTALAHRDGENFFIYGAIPEEKVRAKIFKRRKRVWYAEVVDVIEPSPLRIVPKCPHFGRCGGCTLQHIDYETQLKFKQEIFFETLSRIGNFNHICSGAGSDLAAIVRSPLEWEYRNKMEFSFGRDENGKIFLGLHRRGKYAVLVPVAKNCLLIPEDVRKICAAAEEILNAEDFFLCTDDYFLKFFTVRWSFAQKKALLGITAADSSRNEKIAQFFKKLFKKFPDIVAGGFLTTNPFGSSTSGKIFYLFEKREIYEFIGELKFSISPLSFFQTNPPGAEKLYNLALEFAELSGNERVWDLYCGTGTIGMYFSRKSSQVVGIEENPDAVADARRNAEENEIANITFIEGDVRRVLYQLWQMNFAQPDVVIIDPPRAGLSKKSSERIAQFSPKKIVYISCNPSTLARDALLFSQYGYKLIKARPVDMFPQTYHIEGVALLVKNA
ncbi:23S rRNA (uracil(1939)-C(5))-methyltransferase RlmD [bacterium]|nr:23S rRNA (uracil(1939)-C(5))-methyltransferase RlmD [bacterium]